jgi:Cu/Ag efflux protein CusF
MIRRSCIPTSLAIVISTLMYSQLIAQTPNPQATADPLSKPVTRTATIEAIDRSARLITLKGEDGNLAIVHADEKMKRFDELKVGDKVTATYYESVAVNVRKPGDPAPPASGAGVTPGKGASPGGTIAAQETVSVTVQSIDAKNQSVTVKRQDGGIVSFRVRNPKNLESVKVGDTVDITFTAALLIEVTPAK